MKRHPKITFTLQDIRDAKPCIMGWKKLLRALPAHPPMTLQLSLGDVAKANGAADAIRCIRALDLSSIDVQRRIIAGAVLPTVSRALVYTDDKQVHRVSYTIKRWTKGAKIDLEQAIRAAASRMTHAAETSPHAALATTTVLYAAQAAEAASRSSAAQVVLEVMRVLIEASLTAASKKEEREIQCADIIKAFPPLVLTS